MEDVKLDPKAKWRAKNREKLNQYQRNYWRKKQAAKGLEVKEPTNRLPPDVLTPKAHKLLMSFILGNVGLNLESCREVSSRYVIKG